MLEAFDGDDGEAQGFVPSATLCYKASVRFLGFLAT
jgi:hypothetical protein